MLRRHVTALHVALMAADAIGAMIVFVVASGVVTSMRQPGADWQFLWRYAGLDPFAVAGAYAAAWVTIVWLQGLYRLRVRFSLRAEILDVARSVTLFAVATFTLLFLLKLPDVSRLVLVGLFSAQFIVALSQRIALRGLLVWLRRNGRNARFVLVAGTDPAADAFLGRIERRVDMGLRIIGHLVEPDQERPAGLTRAGRPILGRIEDIEQVLHSRIVDEVVVALAPRHLDLVGPIAHLCEEEGRIVRIPVPSEGLTIAGGRMETVEGVPVLSLVFGPDRAVSLVLKRTLDLAVAGIGLMLLMPLFGVIALAIVALDGRPVFFRQVRVGLHGRPFSVVKFRTMAPDAEERLTDLLARNELTGHAFKVTDDPRISRTGRWLRRSSIDELPQLWNVMKGEMSLVGPRPPLVREVAGYDLWHRRRLSMKPGITGLWQVSARGEQDFDRWVEFDLDYIDRWSLWLDLRIMVRTVPAMLQGR